MIFFGWSSPSGPFTKWGIPEILPLSRVAILYLLVPVHAVVIPKILATTRTDKHMATVFMTHNFVQGCTGVFYLLYIIFSRVETAKYFFSSIKKNPQPLMCNHFYNWVISNGNYYYCQIGLNNNETGSARVFDNFIANIYFI